ncbi:MAG: hypothetical protein EOP56_14670 [Sphingobacteriales bacterium]|nr:MAG: hypothetical protein EOP56_14670 [Sphingobacteriales bacterium]
MRGQVKDYYALLEVSPVASAVEIKKSYRKLAFKYHPDTNPDNAFSATMFCEIQEAYTILSNTISRSKYDEERWLAGMSARAQDQVITTPHWIHMECRKLHAHMMSVDTYRMDHRALYDYIMLLISEEHMAILMQDPDAGINKNIAHLLILSARNIRHPYMEQLADRIRLLASEDEILMQKLDVQIRDSQSTAQRIKYLPYIILIVTSAICAIMYFWVNR